MNCHVFSRWKKYRSNPRLGLERYLFTSSGIRGNSVGWKDITRDIFGMISRVRSRNPLGCTHTINNATRVSDPNFEFPLFLSVEFYYETSKYKIWSSCFDQEINKLMRSKESTKQPYTNRPKLFLHDDQPILIK